LIFPLLIRPLPRSTLFPYTTLFRSHRSVTRHQILLSDSLQVVKCDCCEFIQIGKRGSPAALLGVSLSQIKGKAHIGVESPYYIRSEEHTSELQSRENLVCRLLLEKK